MRTDSIRVQKLLCEKYRGNASAKTISCDRKWERMQIQTVHTMRQKWCMKGARSCNASSDKGMPCDRALST
eukprot:7108474-Lingulodinium_polyedra.AAC.1